MSLTHSPARPSIHPSSVPLETIKWISRRYRQDQLILTTAFGMEGCALIDMCARSDLPITVADIDTGFLFPETQELKQQLIRRYPQLRFVTWRPDLSPEHQAREYGDRLWQNDPNLCCYLRKVLPMHRNISAFQIWMTGLRKSQSSQRSQLQIFQWDWSYQVLKVCPLIHWQRKHVWKYIQRHQVPYNPLHRQGYPSIGCTHCTKPVQGLSSPGTYSRAGRWSGSEKTECGLHARPSTRGC